MKRANIEAVATALLFLLVAMAAVQAINGSDNVTWAQMGTGPFTPEYGTGWSWSADDDASDQSAQQLGTGTSILLMNAGSSTAYCKIGSSSVEAGTADLPILADSYVVVGRSAQADYISCVCATSETTTILGMTGTGL